MNISFLQACESGDPLLLFFQACETDNLPLVQSIAENSHLVFTTLIWNAGLYTACERGHLNIVRYVLLKGAEDVDIGLYYACKTGHLELVKFMVEKGASSFLSCLENACTGEYYDVVFFLLQTGIFQGIIWSNVDFLQQESIQLQLLSDGISRAQLTTVCDTTTLFTKLDERWIVCCK